MFEYALSLGSSPEFKAGDNGGTVINLTLPARPEIAVIKFVLP